MAFVLPFYVHFPYLFKQQQRTILLQCFIFLLSLLSCFNFTRCLLATYLLCFNSKVVDDSAGLVGLDWAGPVGQALMWYVPIVRQINMQ